MTKEINGLKRYFEGVGMMADTDYEESQQAVWAVKLRGENARLAALLKRWFVGANIVNDDLKLVDDTREALKERG